MTYLVIEVNQQNCWYDAHEEQPCPIVVVDCVFRIFPHGCQLQLWLAVYLCYCQFTEI